jgi:uncharacterized protein (DUF4415 family)
VRPKVAGHQLGAKQIAKKAPPIMAKNKRPRHVSAKDWDAVDSRALSDDILAAMRPARETFPELAEASAKRKRGERGPQKKPRKVLISLRVEADTVEAFKAGGRGYQTRMAAVLKKHARQS